MSSSGNEFSGRSVDEAIASGLKALGLRSNQVQVEIVNKGSRGLFGLGSEPAVVRLIRVEETTPIAAPVPDLSAPVESVKIADSDIISNKIIADDGIDEVGDIPPEPKQTRSAETPATVATDRSDATPIPKGDEPEEEVDVAAEEAETEATSVNLLGRLVQLMGFQATVEATWKDEDDEHDDRVLWLNVRGRELSSLIGRRGETLDNIQYLLRMMVNQRLHRWNDIVVDVDQYRARRSEQLTQMALRMADQVVSGGRAMSLEPMPPNERRIIHMALRDHPQVYTQSSGEGERRKIFIVLKS